MWFAMNLPSRPSNKSFQNIINILEAPHLIEKMERNTKQNKKYSMKNTLNKYYTVSVNKETIILEYNCRA